MFKVQHSSDKVLQLELAHILQELLSKKEEGQNLIHTIISSSDKFLPDSRSDEREVISKEVKKIQRDWEELMKNISTARMRLKKSVFQWAAYSSQLQQCTIHREEKLKRVCEQKVGIKSCNNNN